MSLEIFFEMGPVECQGIKVVCFCDEGDGSEKRWPVELSLEMALIWR